MTRQNLLELTSYLMILGEEFGEFLMPPLRCFFLGDNAEYWSSSTATEGRGISERIIRPHAKLQMCDSGRDSGTARVRGH